MRNGIYHHVLADDHGYFLIEVSQTGPGRITIRQLTGRSSEARTALIHKFIQRTFGSDGDLRLFYRFARADSVLSALVKRHRGVRVVGIVDLWECLIWSIIGQQISVAAAFSVRSRLVRATNSIVRYDGFTYEGFPRPRDVLKLGQAAVQNCGFTRQKAEYTIAIAEQIASGKLNENELLKLPRDEIRKRLLAIRGIGPWSCEYAMMRVFLDPDACPLEDIGLRNALAREFGLGKQATIAQTEKLMGRWEPFRGHATFYLWQNLLKT